ncbi:MAG: EAL domain-containing protein [Candidatus Falkowbacteria bacterium]|nr:EAL domain-containing protein [Candidatus Falkowbacteria bacterium]
MLLRYNHPVLGSISPVKFIPILEETHLIDLVGTWVLEESCLVGRLWELSNQPLFIGVNISMLQLDSPDFVSLVANTLKKTKLSPQLLELEITESMIMQNIDSTIAKLTLLRSLGVRIAIDDFGTGYSSLASLKYLPITRLKIDQSFIKNLETSSDDLAMIQTIISLAKNLSICAIAEGGETAYQLDVLRINGCQEMQGFYHSRPIPVSNVLSFVRNEQRLSLQ